MICEDNVKIEVSYVMLCMGIYKAKTSRYVTVDGERKF